MFKLRSFRYLALCFLATAALSAYGQLNTAGPSTMSNMGQGELTVSPFASIMLENPSTLDVTDQTGSSGIYAQVFSLPVSAGVIADSAALAAQQAQRKYAVKSLSPGLALFSPVTKPGASTTASSQPSRPASSSPGVHRPSAQRASKSKALSMLQSSGAATGAGASIASALANGTASVAGLREQYGAQAMSQLSASGIKDGQMLAGGMAGGNADVPGLGAFPDSTLGTALLSQPFSDPKSLIAAADDGVPFATFDMTNKTFLNPSLTGHSEEEEDQTLTKYERYLKRLAKENALRNGQSGMTPSSTASGRLGSRQGTYGFGDALGQKSRSTFSNGLNPSATLSGLSNPY